MTDATAPDEAGLSLAPSTDAPMRPRSPHAGAHDETTGLPGLRGMRSAIADRIAAWTQGDPGLAVVTFDIQGFRHVNESYGHTTGDLLLSAIGQRLRRAVREDDLVGTVFPAMCS